MGSRAITIAACKQRSGGKTVAQHRTIAPYRSDILGVLFEVDVPDVYIGQTERGWAINTFPAGFTPRLPKRLTMRHVEGFDPTTGVRRKAPVADPSATLWTGAATTFDSVGADGVPVTCTVTGYIGEKVTSTPNP
jgi:hypothetical protein